jgi:hypothetical protein
MSIPEARITDAPASLNSAEEASAWADGFNFCRDLLAAVKNVTVSFEQDLDGGLILKVWNADDLSVQLGKGLALFDSRIPATQVPALITQVTGQGVSALLHSISAIAEGECATCENLRTVQVPGSGGRDKTVSCPDCKQVNALDAIKARPSWRSSDA